MPPSLQCCRGRIRSAGLACQTNPLHQCLSAGEVPPTSWHASSDKGRRKAWPTGDRGEPRRCWRQCGNGRGGERQHRTATPSVFGAISTNALNPHVYKAMAFDPRKGFAGISVLGYSTIVLEVPADSSHQIPGGRTLVNRKEEPRPHLRHCRRAGTDATLSACSLRTTQTDLTTRCLQGQPTSAKSTTADRRPHQGDV